MGYFVNTFLDCFCGGPERMVDGKMGVVSRYQAKAIDLLAERVDELSRRLGVSIDFDHPVGISKKQPQNAYWDGKRISVGVKYLEGAKRDYQDLSREQQEYYDLISKVPETKQDLAEYLETLDSYTKSRLAKLSAKHIGIITANELDGILAHELGHAKHKHTELKEGQLFWKVGGVIHGFVGTPKEDAGKSWLGWAQIATAPLGMIHGTLYSQTDEEEADRVASELEHTAKGAMLFFKRLAVNKVLVEDAKRDKGYFDNWFILEEWTSSHPHSAARMEFFAKSLANKKQN